jgi:hypothetical protein
LYRWPPSPTGSFGSSIASLRSTHSRLPSGSVSGDTQCNKVAPGRVSSEYFHFRRAPICPLVAMTRPVGPSFCLQDSSGLHRLVERVHENAMLVGYRSDVLQQPHQPPILADRQFACQGRIDRTHSPQAFVPWNPNET